MALVIESGELEGQIIRRARKEHWCNGWRGRNARYHCKIQIGDYYIGGGWGEFAHWCLDCIPEAKAQIEQQEELDAKLAEMGRTIKRLGQEIKVAKRKQQNRRQHESFCMYDVLP